MGWRTICPVLLFLDLLSEYFLMLLISVSNISKLDMNFCWTFAVLSRHQGSKRIVIPYLSYFVVWRWMRKHLAKMVKVIPVIMLWKMKEQCLLVNNIFLLTICVKFDWSQHIEFHAILATSDCPLRCKERAVAFLLQLGPLWRHHIKSTSVFHLVIPV